MHQEQLSIVAASVDVGLLADRALFLLETKTNERFEDEDRKLLRDSAASLRRLFLDSPEELVMSGNASYLASSQSDWYKNLVESAPKPRSSAGSGVRDWVRAAAQTAEAMAGGEKVSKPDLNRLIGLLDALSLATFEFAERVQGEPRFGGTQWSQRLTTIG